MLHPSDRWVWDFWHVQDQGTHHLFYLQAPKALGDPELRHRSATVGHATSTDLRDWTEHGTVLAPGGAGSIDATATWTGSIVRGADGLWRMFYTAAIFLQRDCAANIETIAVAISDDLFTWRKDPSVELHPDPEWYERLGDSDWPEEAWRDPWVYEADGLWHMLITGRSNVGATLDRGVVAYATSEDLHTWTVRRPLTDPDQGFGQLEVLQRVRIDARDFVLFSTQTSTLSDTRRSKGAETGTWIAPVTTRIQLDHAINLTGPSLYSGRIIDHAGAPMFLAFATTDNEANFCGGIVDPIPVGVSHGKVTLLREPFRSPES